MMEKIRKSAAKPFAMLLLFAAISLGVSTEAQGSDGPSKVSIQHGGIYNKNIESVQPSKVEQGNIKMKLELGKKFDNANNPLLAGTDFGAIFAKRASLSSGNQLFLDQLNQDTVKGTTLGEKIDNYFKSNNYNSEKVRSLYQDLDHGSQERNLAQN